MLPDIQQPRAAASYTKPHTPPNVPGFFPLPAHHLLQALLSSYAGCFSHLIVGHVPCLPSRPTFDHAPGHARLGGTALRGPVLTSRLLYMACLPGAPGPCWSTLGGVAARKGQGEPGSAAPDGGDETKPGTRYARRWGLESTNRAIPGQWHGLRVVCAPLGPVPSNHLCPLALTRTVPFASPAPVLLSSARHTLPWGIV